MKGFWIASMAMALMQVAIATEPAPLDMSAIDRVWSGHSVRFALVVNDKSILVGYYDSSRQMTVASRPRGVAHWTYHKLPSWVGWDSHNYITMAEDSSGHLHVLGNMHADPLLYFRTTAAGDVRTLARVPTLVEARLEQRVTYPVFLKDSAGRLILKFRDGGSGNGNEIYNVYDTATSTWRHLLAAPLTDGEGKRNAYFVGPTLGPDRYFHLAWVWRETPDAETNHDLSYARSRDLVRWERSDGSALQLPITLARSKIVDPVPVRAGMINNNTVVGFDGTGRAMITFHKFDAHGNTQIFVARRETSRWKLRQISDWQNFRWDFRGRGSLDSRLFVSGAVPAGNKRVRVSVVRDGKPIDFLLNEVTLDRIEERAGVTLTERLRPMMTVPEGMQLNTVEDEGTSGIAIAWAARPPHRDLPTPDIPEPTTLMLVVPHEAH